ncbi:hypothetical protein VTK56DRAFT_3221 [Thermocarpiscus australiensis]
MGSFTVSGQGRDTKPSSSRNKQRSSADARTALARQPDKASAVPHAASRRTLAGSVTSFFCRLRPSRRPERGGTARPTTDSAGECGPGGRSPQSWRQKTRSLESDTIPANLWNTATTPPPGTHSKGSKAKGTQRRAARLPPDGKNNAQPDLHFEGSRPPTYPGAKDATSLMHPHQNLPSTGTDNPSEPSTSRELLLAKREVRRQRRTLKESGDFLGVTGVNPYTGEMDVITPPTATSSEDAVTSSPSPTTSGLAAVAGDARDARETYKLAKEKAKLQKEEEKLNRAEQRKDIVRAVLQQQPVKWRREESGWSLVAQPRLSPIAQSPGSGTSSILKSDEAAASAHRGSHSSKERCPFLGMAAVAAVMERRRRITGDMSLAQSKGPEKSRLGREKAKGKRRRASLSQPRTTVRFTIAPPIHRRSGRGQWDARESESSILIDFAILRMGHRGSSEQSMAPDTAMDRVLELEDLSPAEQREDKPIQGPRNPQRDSQPNTARTEA